MKTIGIKLADGSFYPVLEEGTHSQKNLELTTAHNNQTKVMVDLYRSATCSMDDAEYVDSLQIENLNAHPTGEAAISFSVSLDENNELSANIIDEETGVASNTNITLVSRTIEERLVTDEYKIADSDKKARAAKRSAGGLLAAASRIRNEQKIEQDEEPEIAETAVDEAEVNDFNLGDPEANKETIAEEPAPADEAETIAEEPAPADESDNLFVEPAADSTNETVAEEPALSSEAETVAEEPAPADESDNLFVEPAADSTNETVAEEPAPADEAETIAEEPAPADESDNLFVEPELSSEAETVAEEPALSSEAETIVEEPAPADESETDAFASSDLPDFNLDNLEPQLEENSQPSEENAESTDLPDFDFNIDDTSADAKAESLTDTTDAFAEEPADSTTDVFEDKTSDTDLDLPDFNFDDNDSASADKPAEDNLDMSEFDFDLPEPDADLKADKTADYEIPAGNGISFTGLYDKETALGESASHEEDNSSKKTKVPVIICIICAVICVIATLLILFIIPSKYNLISKKAENKQNTEIVQEIPDLEPVVEPAVEPEPEPAPEPVPEAQENEIVIIEKAEEVVPEQPPVVEEKPADITYKIKWGDTLWDISDTYYKNPWRYKYIARYNGIKNPDYIISGTYITIPAE